jgi:Ca2+-transporting ATPase
MNQNLKVHEHPHSTRTTDNKSLPNQAWSCPKEKLLQHLAVSPDKGLSQAEAKKRTKIFGYNRLQETKKTSGWEVLANQFKSLIIIILAAATGISFILGDWMEGIAISVAIFIFIIIGFVTELRAVRSIEALKKLGKVNTKVRRDENLLQIPAQNLVPGDVVAVEGGDIITADLRLIQASKLQADEAVLTGESLPADKEVQTLDRDIPLAERVNMLFKGTSITRGTGEAVVVATGMDTELGKISSLVDETKDGFTPLERRLNQLGHRLIWLTGIMAVFIAGVGIFSGKEISLMIKTSVILAIAAIPEGLPIVATIALARGVWRMAQKNALVERLSSVETLGGTNVICTDKTGTLTEGQMTATQIMTDSHKTEIKGNALEAKGKFLQNGKAIDPLQAKTLKELITVGLLCNNASLQKNTKGEVEGVGEPLEVALLVTGKKAGLDRSQVLDSLPECKEVSFDPATKMMATFHRENGQYKVAVKGAPESVLETSSYILNDEGQKKLKEKDRQDWLKDNQNLAKTGLRILAFATKNTNNEDMDPYKDLVFVGLVGLLDPPRGDIQDAINRCTNAGVKVVMVTGDQPETARAVASTLHLFKENEDEVIHSHEVKTYDDLTENERMRLMRATVFSRVSPEQKLDLIGNHQKSGSTVAMTGDGVNDAPALKKADIGVAMGKRGTQVAQQAADMVLKDDAFSTIVSAISQGRVIFENIRKFISYLLSCNAGSLLSVTFASILNLPLPVLPLQILYLNLVTDVFPAVALGLGEADPEIMNRPPRGRNEPLLTRSHWIFIGAFGFMISLCVIGAMAIALKGLKVSTSQAVTISFLTLGFARVWNVFNMRENRTGVIKNDVTLNPFIYGALAICIGLLLAAVYLPGLTDVLSIVKPNGKEWFLVIGMSLIPFVFGQISKSVKRYW